MVTIVCGHQPLPRELHGASALIGNFDGMHQGHCGIIRTVVAEAAAHGRPSLLITFDPHPFQVLRPTAPPMRLLSNQQRSNFAAQLGLDGLAELPFDQQMQNMTAESFVTDLLVDRLKIASITVGQDFRFGYQRGGDVALLASLAQAGQYTLNPLEKLQASDTPISSSRIRTLISEGLVEAAAELLGRPWSLQGTVVHGSGRGGDVLGYRTLNLRLGNYLRPRFGVYAVWVSLPGYEAPLAGVANIGVRPTFTSADGQAEPIVEVHLFDTLANLYDQAVEVHVMEFLRDEQRFADADGLREQIRHDCIAAQAALGRNPIPPATLATLAA